MVSLNNELCRVKPELKLKRVQRLTRGGRNRSRAPTRTRATHFCSSLWQTQTVTPTTTTADAPLRPTLLILAHIVEIDMAEAISSAAELPATSQTPSAHSTSQHRLLYRGALSLPDSYMLLDGLSFVAESRNNSIGSLAVDLIANPLALALESMRGRPNLHLRGTEKLEDVWLDTRSNITVCVCINLSRYRMSRLSHMHSQDISIPTQR